MTQHLVEIRHFHLFAGLGGGERPHIVFLSPPCKGLSGLLAESLSKTRKYTALNGLTVRGVRLMLEAWGDDPPELVILENVPRIATRGRFLLDQIVQMLRAAGYAVQETKHNCGELGGLGQSRERFLLVARHLAKVPPLMYEPPKRRLRGVGEVIGKLPLPGDPRGGPMHRIPMLAWKTWVRLAFVEAGSDWRSLNKLNVEDGMLRDYAIVPDTPWSEDVLDASVPDPRTFNSREGSGYLGVNVWDRPTGTVTGRGKPGTGAFCIADPRRAEDRAAYGQYGVQRWADPSHTIIGKAAPGAGHFSIAEPRADAIAPRFEHVFRIVDRPQGPEADRQASEQDRRRVARDDEPAGTVITASTTGQGVLALADPNPGYGPGTHHNILAVTAWQQHAKTVHGGAHPAGGAPSVADPRPACLTTRREHYQTGGHYGVVPWSAPTGAIPAHPKNNNGPWSVGDPRVPAGHGVTQLPQPDDRLVAVIRARDGTWHRPFTTLELAALQSLVDLDGPDPCLSLDGVSDSAHRERIGNAVPPDAAAAIAGVMGRVLLLAWSGESFALSNEPIWVQPIAVALSVDDRLQRIDF